MKLINKETTEILQVFYKDNNYKDILDVIKSMPSFEEENIGDFSVYFRILRKSDSKGNVVWNYYSQQFKMYKNMHRIERTKMENIYQQEIRKQKFKILIDETDN